jgi:cation:H+ antiporter
VFLVCSVVTWLGGVQLSKSTDALDARFRLGDAIGGLVLLGLATSLPEVAVVFAGTLNHHYDIVIGNLIGGVAVQTALIALLDARAPKRVPLTYLVGSLTLVIEAATVIAVVVIAIGGKQIPAHVNLLGISPASMAMVLAWILGLLAVNRLRKGVAWKAVAPGSMPGRTTKAEPHPTVPHPFAGNSTSSVIGVFAVAAVFTLAAGWALEESGNNLAGRFGLASGLFGATVLAVVTALPGISTGFAAIKLNDYLLCVSELFGGNALAPTLFIVADALAGTPVIAQARTADIYMAALGILLTSIFLISFIVRPEKTRFRLGIDSRLAVGGYVIGVLGLLVIPGAS